MWAVDSGIPFVNADTCEHYKPVADVVPKKEIANVLSDLKIAVHNKAYYTHAKEIPTFITLREFDAILQNYLNKLK